jgi:CRP/FNR family cyclic AMP-dependent transcriptional regulator
MISRFQGPNAPKQVRAALARNCAIAQAPEALDELCKVVELKEHAKGTDLMVQDGDDNTVAFMLWGEADILVHGRKVATRRPPDHVGEMAAIDPLAPRAATVRATKDTVAAWVKEEDIVTIANAHPALWRHFAQEVSARLRQRNGLVRPLNSRPRVFIGSSSELLDVARGIKQELHYEAMDVYVWTEVFPASVPTMSALQDQAKAADFAIFCLGAEDEVTSRGSTAPASRDNVLFELGLFAGALDIDRCFMLRDGAGKPHTPSDLLGLTQIDFKRRADGSPDLVGPVDQIRARIKSKGPR